MTWPLSDDFEGNTTGAYVTDTNTIFTGSDFNSVPFTSYVVFTDERAHSGAISITSEPSSGDFLHLRYDNTVIAAVDEDLSYWVYVEGAAASGWDIYELWRGAPGGTAQAGYNARDSYLRILNGKWVAYFDTNPPVTLAGVPLNVWTKVQVQWASASKTVTYTLSAEDGTVYGTASRVLTFRPTHQWAFHLLWTHNRSGAQVFIDDINYVPVDETTPYRRIFPRDDGLAGGAPRNFPPSKGRQRSNRTSGYL